MSLARVALCGNVAEVDNVVGMVNLGVASDKSAFAKSRTTLGDGGGGLFYFETNSVTATNLGTVFNSLTATGRWKRLYSGPVNARWFGAKGNGTDNDGPAIRAAVDLLAAEGAGEVFLPSGLYFVDLAVSVGAYGHGILITNNNIGLLGEKGSQLGIYGTPTGHYNVIGIYSCNNVSLRNLTVIGVTNFPGSSNKFGQGIVFAGVSDGKMDTIVVTNCLTDGITLESWSGQGVSRGLFLKNIRSIGNRGNGLSITGADGVLVESSDFSYNTGVTNSDGVLSSCGIDIEAPEAGTYNTGITVVNCTFLDNAAIGLYVQEGGGSFATEFLLSGNRLIGNGRSGITIGSGVTGFTVTDNLVKNSGTSLSQAGIVCGGYHGLVLGNRCVSNYRGFWFLNVSDLVVEGNQALLNKASGFTVGALGNQSLAILLSGNTAIRNATYGFEFVGQGASAINNFAALNGYHGFTIDGVSMVQMGNHLLKDNVAAANNATNASGVANYAIDHSSSTNTLGGNTSRTSYVIDAGTARAGTSNSITLALSASRYSGLYNNLYVEITNGPAAGDKRIITSYDGTNQIAIVSANFTTNPSSSSMYTISNLYSPAYALRIEETGCTDNRIVGLDFQNGGPFSNNGTRTFVADAVGAVGYSGGAGITTVTANLTVDQKHSSLLVDTSSGAVTITLPPSAKYFGQLLAIKKINSSTNAVILSPSGAETIDGAASDSFTNQWQVVRLQSNGTNWFKL